MTRLKERLMINNYTPELDATTPVANGTAQADIIPFGTGCDLLSRDRLDAFTHTRLWKNPCATAPDCSFRTLQDSDRLHRTSGVLALQGSR